MENVKNIRDLNDIVLETKLELKNIKPIFTTVLSNENPSKLRSFFLIGQNTLVFATLVFFSDALVERICECGTHISQTSHELLLKTYAEQRQVLIVTFSESIVLVSEREMISLLLNKTKRYLAEGKLLKRRIDADVLTAMLLSFSGHETIDVIKDNCNDIKPGRTAFENKKGSSHLFSVPPRDFHGTTYVESDRNDVYEEDIAFVTIPNDKTSFENDGYYGRHEVEEFKFSTQVTEDDAGLPSFEPYLRHTPTMSFAARNAESDQTNLSNREDGLTMIHQAALRGNMVTSSSGLPFRSKPSRYMDFRDQMKRQESFHTTKWLADSKPAVNLLVKCGFFFTGNQDLVRCFHCGIGLKDWIKDDDVLNEHVKYSPSCDFLNWEYGKSFISRMKETMETENDSKAASRPPPLQYKIRSPRYQTMEARIASFENFPSRIDIPHQQLGVAGLYYTGQGDLCRCFTCDGGLKDWKSGDDPIKEHASYFPNCPYINKLKGTDYVQLQQQSRTPSEQVGAGATGGNNTTSQQPELSPNLPIDRLSLQDTEYSSFNVSQVVQKLGYSELDVISAKAELQKKGISFPSAEDIVNIILDLKERAEQVQSGASGQDSKTDLKAIVEENKKLTRLIYCMLCVNGEADMLFLPCTHHRTCHECAADLIFCPVCDQFIKEKVKTFRA